MVFFRKLMTAMLVLVMCFSAAPAHAQELAQDGLRIELSAEPEECASGEEITGTLTVINEGSAEALDLRMELILPEGWELPAGSQRVKEIPLLAPGETAVLEAALLTGLPETAAQPTAQTQLNRAVREAPTGATVGIAGAAVGGLLLGLKLLGGMRMMSLVLCGAMLCGLFAYLPVPAHADSGHWLDSVTAETVVTVDGQQVHLRGRVSYRLGQTPEQIPTEPTPTEPAPMQPNPSDPLVLEVDECYFLAGHAAEATFTARAASGAQVNLFCDGAPAGAMHDDGTAGDAVAGDGIYSCRLSVTRPGEGQAQYHAEAGTRMSNQVTLYHFRQLDAEGAAQAEAVLRSISGDLQAIEVHYADENGYVPAEQVGTVLAAVRTYLVARSQSGEILLWEVDDTGAYIKLASGLTLMYEPALEGVSAPGDEVSLRFMAYQPNPDVSSSSLDTLVEYLAGTFDTESKSYANGQVTLELVKSFGPDRVILWNGHGGYGPIIKSYLASGEYFDWAAWWFDIGYYFDCVQDRILNRSTEEQDGLACFTHKFISHYCGDLSGDLVFLSACHSGQNEKLAKAFRDKGAEAVVGFTESVYSAYCESVVLDTALTMSTTKLETGNYYTLAEALDRAIRKYGADDLVFARNRPQTFTTIKAQAAKPVIFGDRDYRYRQTEIGILSGRVCDAADRTAAIPGAQVIVGWENFDQWNATTGDRGDYAIEIPAEYYPITVRAPGYLDFTAYAEVREGETTYLETYLMVAQSEQAEAAVSGVISSSLTGAGIGGVRIQVRSGWNNTGHSDVLAETFTDDSGAYTLNLPLGNYTLALSREGFVDTILNIVSVAGNGEPQNGSMTPSVSGGDYRIVLTWAAHPRDLDSHVCCTMPSEGGYHVYYRQKTHQEGGRDVCVLDLDDTNGWGPETVTLHTEATADYRYYVHRYAGTGTIADSGAQIRVYQGDQEIAVVNAPTGPGSGDYWNVLTIQNGVLTVVNTITDQPELP